MNTLKGMILAGALALGIGSVACSNNEEEKAVETKESSDVSQKTYQIAIPRRDGAGNPAAMKVYITLANELSERFSAVTILPETYECRYNNEKMKLECEEKALYQVTRRNACGDDTTCKSLLEADRAFLNAIADKYGKRFGISQMELHEADGSVKGMYVSTPANTLATEIRGEREDFSALTEYPDKPDTSCCAANTAMNAAAGTQQ
jgi:hypothetical protein